MTVAQVGHELCLFGWGTGYSFVL